MGVLYVLKIDMVICANCNTPFDKKNRKSVAEYGEGYCNECHSTEYKVFEGHCFPVSYRGEPSSQPKCS